MPPATSRPAAKAIQTPVSTPSSFDGVTVATECGLAIGCGLTGHCGAVGADAGESRDLGLTLRAAILLLRRAVRAAAGLRGARSSNDW